jgi:hypothetical protein
MKIYFLRCAVIVAFLLCTSYDLCRGSDHADPQSVTNPFYVQPEPNANITDLHAFIVDKLIGENNHVIEGEHLIVSLCVRRALTPEQARMLTLKGYKFRVHFDLDPKVRIFDETKTPEGQDYAEELAKAAPARRADLISKHDADRSMQALYGGITTDPGDIKEDALLEFELELTKRDLPQAVISGKPRADGFKAAPNVVSSAAELRPEVINIQAGIFDDPFIFPRFFRRNVVGIVTAIPLSAVPLPHGKGPILLWATTHKGEKQVDHVGRSLRTQLPRFGYLNDKPPSEHVKEITRVHDRPTLMEDILATFISPLEAHRHYDSVPDVVIYDLRKPAKFPNGRALRDDVAKALADGGETLLVELAYTESKQFPRAETNDKEFRETFPYLAERWTPEQIKQAAPAGSMMGSFAVPRAPDSSAIAFPNLKESTWRKMFALEMIAIVMMTVLVLVFLWPVRPSQIWIVLAIALAVIGILLLFPLKVTAIVLLAVLALVFLSLLVQLPEIWIALAIALAVIGILLLTVLLAPNATMPPANMLQPGLKFRCSIIGLAFIGVLFTWASIAFGAWWAERRRVHEHFPPGEQGLQPDEPRR